MSEFEKTERLRDEIKNSKFSHVLMLGFTGLHSFPTQIFQYEYMNTLQRLDLTHNYITKIPSGISQLVNLKEIWLASNPIEVFPLAFQHLTKLEVIDMKNTKISAVPYEIAKLTKLYELDWDGTPFAKILFDKHQIEVNDIVALKDLLVDLHTRKQYEEQLFEKLFGEHFIMDADKPSTKGIVKDLVQNISDAFPQLPELKQFVRRADKLLPPSVDLLTNNTIEKAQSLFYQMQRDTTRARMAADVEIKIRGMYFDKIERSAVTVLLDSIYAHVESLEDICFLVQYAPQVLPPNSEDANGAIIWDNICQLQSDLTSKREASIAGLAGGLSQIYPEQKPEQLRETASQIASYFQLERFATKRELTTMSQLMADCAKICPPDFASVNCDEIVKLAHDILHLKP